MIARSLSAMRPPLLACSSHVPFRWQVPVASPPGSVLHTKASNVVALYRGLPSNISWHRCVALRAVPPGQEPGGSSSAPQQLEQQQQQAPNEDVPQRGPQIHARKSHDGTAAPPSADQVQPHAGDHMVQTGSVDVHGLLLSAHDPLASASNPWFFARCFAVFIITALDVFHPAAPHFLPVMDAALHTYAQTLSPTASKFWADIVLSDTFIVLGLGGWAACTVAAALSKKKEAVAAVAIAWGVYAWGAGPLQYDPWLVDLLKNWFERPRPSPVHWSFSFPSGHTSSATFTVGALLFVLLPAVFGRRRPRGTTQSMSVPSISSTTVLPVDTAMAQAAPSSSERSKGLKLLPAFINSIEGSWTVWGVACVTTAAGRVLADAHWLSDTVAATALGGCVVSVLARAVRPLVQSARHNPSCDAAPAATPDAPAPTNVADEKAEHRAAGASVGPNTNDGRHVPAAPGAVKQRD